MISREREKWQKELKELSEAMWLATHHAGEPQNPCHLLTGWLALRLQFYMQNTTTQNTEQRVDTHFDNE
jgi:hypothetical protein